MSPKVPDPQQPRGTMRGDPGTSHGDFLHHAVSDVDFVRLDSDGCRLTAQVLVVLPVLKGEHTGATLPQVATSLCSGEQDLGQGPPPNVRSCASCVPNPLAFSALGPALPALTFKGPAHMANYRDEPSTQRDPEAYLHPDPSYLSEIHTKEIFVCARKYLHLVLLPTVLFAIPKVKKSWSQPHVHRRFGGYGSGKIGDRVGT